MATLQDPTYSCSDTTDTGLEDFFARPIKIYSFSWTVGNNVFASPNPWKLYFDNARVVNRIANYRNIRCQLNMKIVLNGNGFHYGRILASYLPYANIDILTKQGRNLVPQDAIAESQRPHLYLDPSCSQGGTLSVPFFWHKNNLDIVNEEWEDMGDLVFRSLQPLSHANGATDSVTVSVFAWITNVTLSGPTSTNPGNIVAQAGIYDEYSANPISAPMNTLAAIASKLKDMPIISPFAKATEVIATSVGAVAKLFGYSRPNNLEPIAPYKPTYVGDLSCVNNLDTAVKLSADCKQELTIDPRTVGLPPVDELNIRYLATKESYLTQFSWDIADAAETLLWNCYVTPALFDTVGTGASKEHHMTASCFATHPFKYWRGTMRFRFMVVASAYQKGRLRINYDPWLKTGTEYNTNYNTIVDLASDRDFTIEIGWANSRSYLKIMHANVATILPFSTAALTTPYEDFMNGVLSVFVVNELTTPNSTVTNDAAVNVLVSAGDDIDVSIPTMVGLTEMRVYEEQSGEYEGDLYDTDPNSDILSLWDLFLIYTGQIQLPEVQAGEVSHADQDATQEQSAPEQSVMLDHCAAPEVKEDNTLNVFFADPICSLRTLMKRYCFSIQQAPQNFAINKLEYTNKPLDPGYDAHGIHVTTTAAQYNYAEMTWVGYVSSAFAGWRGGLRWKHQLCSFGVDSTAPRPVALFAYNHLEDNADLAAPATVNTIPVNTETYSSAARRTYYQKIGNGAITTPYEQNPCVEIETPYYSYNRFSPNKTYTSAEGSEFNPQHHLLASGWMGAANNEGAYIVSFCAAGEDYSPFFYIGPPVFYFFSDPTPG